MSFLCGIITITDNNFSSGLSGNIYILNLNKLEKTQMKKIIPIFFAVDNAYVKLLHVALHGLVSHASKEYTYYIHVINEGLTKENKDSLKTFESDNFKIFIDDVSEIAAEYTNLMEGKYYNGSTIYYRAFIPRLFPQYKKAIYLDSDIAINGDISEFYNIDLDGNYIIAVTEPTVQIVPAFREYVEKFIGVGTSDKYFNSGVIVLNCDKLRKINFQEKFFNILKKVQLDVAPDQDVLNYLCRGKVVYAPRVWNANPNTEKDLPIKDIKLLHYNLATKPWIFDKIPHEDLFWNHAKQTMFYKELRKGKESIKEKDTETAMGKLYAIMEIADKLSKGPSLDMQLNNKKPHLLVQEKIKAYEKYGWLNKDVNDDPPWEALDYKKVDYFKKKLSSKIKMKWAYHVGLKYLNGIIKAKQFVLETKGLENLEGFNGGAIVTCNHCHIHDHFMVLVALKQHFKDLKNNRLYKVTREGNYCQPGWVGLLMRNCDTLPVNEEGSDNMRLTAKTVSVIGKLLQMDKKILIYPEQALWMNYKKPRPYKNGAFTIAAKNNAPIIPCFVTMKEIEELDKKGNPITEFTFHILPILRPDPNLSVKENTENLKNKNFELCKDLYEKTYGIKLKYAD